MLALDVSIEGRSFVEGGSPKTTKKTGREDQRTKYKSVHETEERLKSLAACMYEHGTQWGDEIGLKYGYPAEDIITGLTIHCRGWMSVHNNPPRPAFLGVAPTTLAQTLLQHKRWSDGAFSIFLSKYCPFLFGHGKIKLRHQMGYSIYGLWAPNSLPTLYYVIIPSLALLKGTSLFPEVMVHSEKSLILVSYALY
jgi:cellulose synthase/poly-beta-1,6-N-acetylglucosamine synthase-like glycosyltransferase